jgi:hypothetical protein
VARRTPSSRSAIGNGIRYLHVFGSENWRFD